MMINNKMLANEPMEVDAFQNDRAIPCKRKKWPENLTIEISIWFDNEIKKKKIKIQRVKEVLNRNNSLMNKLRQLFGQDDCIIYKKTYDKIRGMF